ncbi:unnamed protein product, partial [Scytosiphon promiscuus]
PLFIQWSWCSYYFCVLWPLVKHGESSLKKAAQKGSSSRSRREFFPSPFWGWGFERIERNTLSFVVEREASSTGTHAYTNDARAVRRANGTRFHACTHALQPPLFGDPWEGSLKFLCQVGPCERIERDHLTGYLGVA